MRDFYRLQLQSLLMQWRCFGLLQNLRLPASVRQATQSALDAFKAQAADGLAAPLDVTPNKRALVVSVGFPAGVPAELGLIKALQLAGYDISVVSPRHFGMQSYYDLVPNVKVRFWDTFFKSVSKATVDQAFAQTQIEGSLLSIRYAGLSVGTYVASTLLRAQRTGTLDVQSEALRSPLYKALYEGLRAADVADPILNWANPDLVMFVDRGYSPQGQLFERCLERGLDTFTWNAGHKNNTIIFKRYAGQRTQLTHPVSLSEKTWQQVIADNWTPGDQAAIEGELRGTYERGEWYSEVGTQTGTQGYTKETLFEELHLDPNRKTAIIFPHILWDGTFFWGEDLFENYEAWLVETVRAAVANDKLNWIIKLHPANRVKNARDGIVGKSAEELAIEQHVGALPDHVRVLPETTKVSTYSIYSMVDYCVTVRGTVGIEAAMFGIPVLTAGTGRYDRLGFTTDFKTQEDYLQALSVLQEIPPLTSEAQELANRFAHALLLQRPLQLKTFTLAYGKDSAATIQTDIFAKTAQDWMKGEDIQQFIAWIQSGEEDFLTPKASVEAPSCAAS